MIKLGGGAVESPRDQVVLWRTLEALHCEEPGGSVIVHGGGARVDRLLQALGLPVRKINGIRVTPPDQIDHVVAVLAGTMNTTIVGALRVAGANAVGLTIGSGGTVRASLLEEPGLELGRVGIGSPGDPALLHTLLDGGFLPVLSSMGLDEEGDSLNVNADQAAGAVARTIGARAIVVLTDVPGVLDDSGNLIAEVDGTAIDSLIESAVIHSGMVVKVRAALECAEQAGCPVVIASWKEPEVLAGLTRGERIGTRIVAELDTGLSSEVRASLRDS